MKSTTPVLALAALSLVAFTGCATNKIGGISSRSEPARLVTNGWKASWSPGGKQLAYGLGQGSGIALLDLKTLKSKPLTDLGKDVAWSPDGKYIAFVREQGYNNYLSETVWIVKSEGGPGRALVPGGFPVWSADAKSLYVHCRQHNHVVALSVDDLTRTNENFYADTPAWYFAVSPDGTRLAFGSQNQLQIFNREKRELVQFWALPEPTGLLPAWSPDGKLVAFGGFDTSGLGVWVFDTQTARAVPVKRGHFTMPSWSPDGKWLAFDDRGADGRSIMVVGRPYIDSLLSGQGSR